MRFSLFTIFFGAVASVRAAVFRDSSISSGVQKCLDEIKAIDAKIGALKNSLSAFTSSQGYPGALDIHNSEQKLENIFVNANKVCCAIDSVTDQEASAFFAEISVLVPHMENVLSLLNSKKPEIKSIFLADVFVNADIKGLKAKTADLDACLFNITPANRKEEARNYVNTVNKIYATVYRVWGI